MFVLKLVLAVVAGLAFLLLAYVVVLRFAPIDAARWHLDPLTAPPPGIAGVRVLPEELGAFAETPEALFARVDAAVSGHPRASYLAGDDSALHQTYVYRTKLLGFPDLVSFRTVPMEGGAGLAIIAQTRLGGSDYGVNKARVSALLARIKSMPAPENP